MDVRDWRVDLAEQSDDHDAALVQAGVVYVDVEVGEEV